MKKIVSSVRWRIVKAKESVTVFFKPFYFQYFRSKVECNICGWRDNAFKSDGWHPFTVCPNCHSQVRQRLFWSIVHHSKETGINNLIAGKKVLHIAPDACLSEQIKTQAGEYVTADLLTEGYQYSHIDLNMDMANMKQIKDDEFDCVIAFDVLEHIPDHLKAIQETNRVLKRGGYCVFTVPQKDGLKMTFEDTSITDPKRREELFGQSDHYRIYGNDFKEMMESRGFSVSVLDEKSLEKEKVNRYVLYPPVLSGHPLASNNRKVYFGKKL